LFCSIAFAYANEDVNVQNRSLVAELLGTAFLLAAIVGLGIMGERLAAGNVAVALLANSLATGAALVALILTFGSISGAHFNPLVSLAAASQGEVSWREASGYSVAQIVGALIGVAVANLMFGEPAYAWSHHSRSGWPLVFSETVATFGLLSVIAGCARRRPDAVPFAVAAYITAAYWFTSSTSFANPAVTLARAMTDTFSGILPNDVPGFLLGQVLGASAATVLVQWLAPPVRSGTERVLVAQDRKITSGV
jgi:glycerol uptake facilitator-like aquaporin